MDTCWSIFTGRNNDVLQTQHAKKLYVKDWIIKVDLIGNSTYVLS